MNKNFTVFLQTATGREFSLSRNREGIYDAPEGRCEIRTERVGIAQVLRVKAALTAQGETLSEDAALTVRLPNRKVRFVADKMHGEFWCRPEFGEELAKVPPRTQALLWKEGKVWRLLWPLCGKKFNCVLTGGEKGLDIQLFSFAPGLTEIPETACVLLAAGKDPHALLRGAAEAAERVLCGRVKTIDRKTFPEIFEYLGWCSWDAFQIRVSEAGLAEKADEFLAKKIPVRWCIIDDMWGHVKGLNEVPADLPFAEMVKVMHGSTLYEAEADPTRFPNGLSGAIDTLHRKGFKVGVWYPTTGYWKGVDPNGPLAARMADDLVMTPAGKLVVKPTREAAERFHTAMQEMIQNAGGDFVKVDNQSHYRNTYRHLLPVGEAAAAIQGAIETVTKEHFGDGLINCMGMASECMWNRPESAVSRCSDDFMPENRAWFAKHILQCSYNSLFQGQFYFSDWDMWWTDDAQALKNSVCRAISGGPVYVSDKLGRSRGEILSPLCFSDGKLLRATGQATPTNDCLLTDPRTADTPFKIFNRVNGCGVLAAFNLHEENKPQTGEISAADAGMRAGRYLVCEQLTGENFVLERGERFTLTLPDHDAFRLYLFLPLSGRVTPLGRTDKFLSPAAILRRSQTGIRLYEGGKLGLFGVSRIATNLRPEVEGTQKGVIWTFNLAPNETEIRYLIE